MLGPVQILTMLAAAATLAGCAASLRSENPEQLYTALVAEQIGYTCVAVEDGDLNDAVDEARSERWQRMRPWLVAQLGEERMAAIRAEEEEMEHGVYYLDCPSVEERQRHSMRIRRLFREIERRARTAR